MGVEPTSSAWKAEVLPLNYTRQAQSQRIPSRVTSSHLNSKNGGGGRIRTSEGGAVRFTV
jgi:hypothetical protein